MYMLKIRTDKDCEELQFDNLKDCFNFAKQVSLDFQANHKNKDLELIINGKTIFYNQVTDNVEYL